MGWVYQYMITAKNRTLDELRAIQDWFVRYQLTKAQGVAEIASVGGFSRQYQVTVNPRLLQAYGVPLNRVMQVIRDSNRDVGGRVVEMAETEYMVRGKGYLRGIGDIENVVVGASATGTPIRVAELGRVSIGPASRRGVEYRSSEVSTITHSKPASTREMCSGSRIAREPPIPVSTSRLHRPVRNPL